MRGEVAVVEMARASGLALVAGRNDPLAATTYGTGELIRAALDDGAARIIVAVGGSATTDGGLGALEALDFDLRGADVVVACDVTTTFVDAARVYGPQKGADDGVVAELERRLDGARRALPGGARRRRTRAPGSGAPAGSPAGSLPPARASSRRRARRRRGRAPRGALGRLASRSRERGGSTRRRWRARSWGTCSRRRVSWGRRWGRRGRRRAATPPAGRALAVAARARGLGRDRAAGRGAPRRGRGGVARPRGLTALQDAGRPLGRFGEPHRDRRARPGCWPQTPTQPQGDQSDMPQLIDTGNARRTAASPAVLSFPGIPAGTRRGAPGTSPSTSGPQRSPSRDRRRRRRGGRLRADRRAPRRRPGHRSRRAARPPRRHAPREHGPDDRRRDRRRAPG